MNGFVLTSATSGVLFDLDADGQLERVAWTRAGSDDAWLAFDRNGNGTIDDGSELFGNYTPVYPGMTVTTQNGFEALKFYEGPDYGPSTADGIIDAKDAIFSRLLLWRDLNHDGISQPDELQRVADSNLRSVSTDYKLSQRHDRHGNAFRQRAKAKWANGLQNHVYDVWLTAAR